MEKYSLRQLKSIVKEGCATDISMYDCDMREDLVSKHGPLTKIGYAHGTYGLTGILLKDHDGRLYAITQRSTALFIFS